MVRQFQEAQPELGITDRECRLVKLAGLVHDLGHGPFSHVFENEFMARVKKKSDDMVYHHEKMSLDMLDYLIHENDIDIPTEDVVYVKHLITGQVLDPPHPHPSSSKAFLYQIVANKRNGIDVDKLDYLARDHQNLFGSSKGGYDYSRLWSFHRVIDDEICYHESVGLDIST